MFQGAAALSLDAKGRLAIPARHRDALAKLAGSTLVLTAHPHRCLLIYPAPAWEPIRDKVLAGSSLEQRSALLKQAQQIIADDYVNAYLFQLPKTGVAKAEIEGLWENAPMPANDLTGVSWKE